MKCVVCKQAETRPGVTTVTLERAGATFVVREVPAQVCPNCGEDYVDDKVAAELLRSTEELSRAGTQVDIRRYAAAA
jgi:YgiT-type zinc finger domain-containing protein